MTPDNTSHFLLKGNCLDVLPQFPDGIFDAVITDPPYVTAHKDIKVLKGRKPISMDFGEWDYLSDTGFTHMTASWIVEAARVIKPMGNLVVFTKLERLGVVRHIYEQAGFKHHSTIIWHKTNPPPKVRKTGFLSACEGILWATRGFDDKRVSYTFNFLSQKLMHNFIETPICMGRERFKHPTQKPRKVFDWLLEIFTNRGDLILDCFAGSGTLADAAGILDRRSVSIECDPNYFSIMLDRMNSTNPDSILVAPEAEDIREMVSSITPSDIRES